DLALSFAIAEAEPAMRGEVSEQQILAHGKVGHDGLAASILSDESNAGADRVRRRARSEWLPLIAHPAAGAGAKAEERFDGLRAPGSDQAAEAENLAAMQ